MGNGSVDEILSSLMYEPRRCKCKKKMDIKVSESRDNPKKLYYKCLDCDTFYWAVPRVPDDLRMKVAEIGQQDPNEKLLKKMDAIACGVKLIGWCLCVMVVVCLFKM